MVARANELGTWGLPGTGKSMQGQHTYTSATDSTDTMIASGYFDIFSNEFNKGDYIYVTSGFDDNSFISIVQSERGVTPVVTRTLISEGGPFLPTGNILVGDSNDEAQFFDASGNNLILAGNGTTVVAVKLNRNMVDASAIPSLPLSFNTFFDAGGTGTVYTDTSGPATGVLSIDIISATVKSVSNAGAHLIRTTPSAGQISFQFTIDPGAFAINWIAHRAIT
jgi:hypothetical protein